MRIGIICSRVRPEEKLLFEAIRSRNAELVRIDDRDLVLDLEETPDFNTDIILDRSINFSRSRHITKALNDRGVVTINSADVINTCGDLCNTVYLNGNIFIL